MNSKYLVKLTPHTPFFFGGENSFGGEDGSQKNYLVKSNYFPQQTGILGLVRHQLLIQNNLLRQGNIRKEDKTVASRVIGPTSFRLSAEILQFGAIMNISSVFIMHGENSYFPANKEYQFDEGELQLRNFTSRYDLPLLENYDPKSGLPDLLVNKSLTDFKQYDYDIDDAESGIFIEQQQTGIHKNYYGVTDLNAYYLQTRYDLKKDWSFAFLLELRSEVAELKDKKIVFESQDHVVFGGEQSAFKMEVIAGYEKSLEELLPDYPAHENFEKIVLVSDTYLANKNVLDPAVFAISETANFRFLKTEIADTNNYAALSKPGRNNRSNGKLYKSARYHLLKKGSVIYTKNSTDSDAIIAGLKNDRFELIGYNQLKKIPIKS